MEENLKDNKKPTLEDWKNSLNSNYALIRRNKIEIEMAEKVIPLCMEKIHELEQEKEIPDLVK